MPSSNHAPVITSNYDLDSFATNVDIFRQYMLTVSATDTDPGDVIHYSIVGGADADLFQIDEDTGELSTTQPSVLFYGHNGGSTPYTVIVAASDGISSDTQTITFQVTRGALTNVYGSNTNQIFYGDGGPNRLMGFEGNDYLFGYAGNDKLYGLAGTDHLDGGRGNDLLDGGAGADYLEGGRGNDIYYVDDAGDVVKEYWDNGLGGYDTVYSSISYVAPANVESVKLIGTADIDATARYNEFSLLTGNSGANKLTGGQYADYLYGNAGNDTLIGGGGADILSGGTGSDQFVFDTLSNGATGDNITDFQKGQDHLVFDRAVFTGFAGEAAGAIDPDLLGFGTEATTAEQRLIYNSATGALSYDADGVGGVDAVIVASLTGHPALTAGDILLL